MVTAAACPTANPADPLRRRALALRARRSCSLREEDEIGDDAFHRMEEELDSPS